MLAWASATNDVGGIQGRQNRALVRLLYHDDGSNSATAARNTKRLIQEGVQILLGPYSSELMIAAVSVAAQRGRLIWNHGGASDGVHRLGAHIVGILTSASRYFTEFPSLALRINPQGRSLVCFYHAGSNFGRKVVQGALVAARQLGMGATTRTYRSSEAIPRLIQELKEVDFVLSAGSFQDDVCLAHELLQRRLPIVACGLVAAGMTEFRYALGDGHEGFLAPSQWEPSVRPQVDFGPQSSEVAARIAAQGVAVDYPAAQAYAACLLAQHCLEQTEDWDDSNVWRTAWQLDCTTFFGRFKIDPSNGLQTGHHMVWLQWQKGEKAIVWPTEYAGANPLPFRQVGEEID